MATELDFQQAYQDLLDSGLSEDEAARQAWAFTQPAMTTGTPRPRAFIGNPNAPASNQFDFSGQPNGISSWTAPLTSEQASRLPWNAGVQPAGGAFELPGERQTAIDFEESTGVPLNAIRDKIALAGSTIRGLPGEVPNRVVTQWENDAKQNLDAATRNIRMGGDPQKTIAEFIAPTLNSADQIIAEYRHRMPPVKRTIAPPEYREIEGAGGRKMGVVWNPQTGSFQKFNAASPIPPDVQRQLNRLSDELDMAAKGFLSAQGPIPPDPIKAAQIADEIVRTRRMYGIEMPVPPEPAGAAPNVRTNSLPKILSIRRR